MRWYRLVALVLSGLSTVAVAGETVTTMSGCNTKAGGSEACKQCVKSGGRWVSSLKRKGAFACEGAGGSGGDANNGPGSPYWHKSKSVGAPPPPKKPASMPKATFVTIEPGAFVLGSPPDEQGRGDTERAADVTLTRAFLMQATEVTNGQWHFLMGEPSSAWFDSCGYECPLTQVSFRQTLEYLNALSKKDGLETCYVLKKASVEWPKGLDCKGYRLPTQAEWEYAARATDTGSGVNDRDEVAWHYDNSDGVAHPVGTKKANAWGLFDLRGNVAEWTWDGYEYVQEDATDPIVGGTSAALETSTASASTTTDRILKGGSFYHHPLNTRPAFRERFPVDSSAKWLGFRPVRTK
jgi:formylglycine-generating enzyme required for sulfatase activity